MKPAMVLAMTLLSACSDRPDPVRQDVITIIRVQPRPAAHLQPVLATISGPVGEPVSDDAAATDWTADAAAEASSAAKRADDPYRISDSVLADETVVGADVAAIDCGGNGTEC